MRSVCVRINVNDGRRMKMKLVYLVILCRSLETHTFANASTVCCYLPCRRAVARVATMILCARVRFSGAVLFSLLLFCAITFCHLPIDTFVRIAK